MAQNKAALIKAALEEILRLGSGQSVAVEDSAAVDAMIAPMLDELSNARVIAIGNVEAIPDYAFPALVRLLAQEIAGKFGGTRDEAIVAASRQSLIDLTRRQSSTPLVLAVLEQLQLAGISVATIDAAMVGRRVPSLLSNLAARNVIYIADQATVEEDDNPAFHDLASWIASQLAPAQLGADAPFLEARLRQLKPTPSLPVAKPDYF